jgi:nitric oxide reductase NorD protein
MADSAEVRAELVKILGQVSFGEDVIVQRYTGTHYARGTHSIDEATPGLTTLGDKDLKGVYKLGKRLAKRDPEMAFYYFKTAPDAIEHFSFEDMEKWVERGIELYEGYGVVPARNFFKGITRELINEIRTVGLQLEDVANILTIYVNALSGRQLKITGSEETYTDTRTIFLPAMINEFPSKDDNFKVYKVIVAHKYAQMRYRSLDLILDRISETVEYLQEKYSKSPPEDVSHFEKFFTLFPDRGLALKIYELVENARIERYLSMEFKGLSRDLAIIKKDALTKMTPPQGLSEKELALDALQRALLNGEGFAELPEDVSAATKKCLSLIKEMLAGQPSSEDSARVTANIYAIIDDLPGSYRGIQGIVYVGTFKPERVTAALKQTEEELKDALRDIYEITGVPPRPELLEEKLKEIKGELSFFESIDPEDFIMKLGVKLPEELTDEIIAELEKRLGELGELDSSMFVKVLESTGKMIRAQIAAPPTTFQVEMTEEDMIGATLYDEWDYEAGSYRAAWCALREKLVERKSNNFVEKTLEKHSGLVSMIRRQFEMLRPEYKKLKRQKEGEEIDLDAVIEARADMQAGLQPSEDLYIKTDKRERDIAVTFLVDMSGSTTGWVIETEKDSLVLMCEALEQLDDRYAIYGFSGKTRKQCDFYKIKTFEDKYDEDVKQRIAGMDAFDYTRMGAPIRHLTKIMEDVPARTKIMIILSDGKPEDFDEYKGEHGIEDTRKALIEAKQKHIRPFCVTIDVEARDYIQHMYGEVTYIIVDNVEKLPRKLPEIYRKLTT